MFQNWSCHGYMKELKLRNSPLGGRGSFCKNRAQEVGKDDEYVLAYAGSDQTSATEGSAQKGAGSDQHGIIAGGSAGVPDKGVQKHVGTAGLSAVVVIPTQWVSAGYAVLVSDPGFMMSDGPPLEPASVSIAGADWAVLSLLGALPHWALGLFVFAESCYMVEDGWFKVKKKKSKVPLARFDMTLCSHKGKSIIRCKLLSVVRTACCS